MSSIAALRNQLPILANSSTSTDIEPDSRWKAELRQRIEGELKYIVSKTKENYNNQINDPSLDHSSAQDNYSKAMSDIRRIAEDQYQYAVEEERQKRRWSIGQNMDDVWFDAIVKEQQAILSAVEKDAPTQFRKNVAENAIQSEEPVGRLARFIQRGNTATPEPGIRTRKPSSTFSEVFPRLPLDDRESFRTSSPIPRLRNGERARDLAVNFGSPPKPKPEIWIPTGSSFKENVTSRTLAHATGTGITKPTRVISASSAATNSMSATITPRSSTPRSWSPRVDVLDEDFLQREKHMKFKDEAMRRKEGTLNEEELRRKEEELKRKEEELRRKEEELERKEEEIRRREEELRRKEEKAKWKEEKPESRNRNS